MQKRVIAYPALVLIAFAGLYSFLIYRTQTRVVRTPKPASAASPDQGIVITTKNAASSTAAENGPRQVVPEKAALVVPFVSESPEGSWKGPWINGCEEASIAMVHFFYAGQSEVSRLEAQNYMQDLFAAEDATWGSNANTDAARTEKLINVNTDFKAEIKENPTGEDIKREIRAGYPVISLHYGKTLANPNIPFARNGSYYHMLVVTGYDDTTNEFIVNDDGDRKEGTGHRYGYATFMQSLHDYDYADKLTDGPPRVIFTRPKSD